MERFQLKDNFVDHIAYGLWFMIFCTVASFKIRELNMRFHHLMRRCFIMTFVMLLVCMHE